MRHLLLLLASSAAILTAPRRRTDLSAPQRTPLSRLMSDTEDEGGRTFDPRVITSSSNSAQTAGTFSVEMRVGGNEYLGTSQYRAYNNVAVATTRRRTHKASSALT